MNNHENLRTKRTLFGKKLQLKIIIPIIIILIIGIIFAVKWINASVWNSRLSSQSNITLDTDDAGTFIYSIEINTEDENQVRFEASTVNGDAPTFYVSSCDLIKGSNVLRYTVEREDHSRTDSLIIENNYTPITLNTRQQHDSRNSTTKLQITTEPGNTLSFMGIDTTLQDGTYSIDFNPDSILDDYDPNITPTLVVSEQIQVANPSGNIAKMTEDLKFCFPRVSIGVSDPYNSYISRTGSGYTIRGYGEQGVRVTFSGASSGYTTIGYSGNFSKWVSVPDFGENYYFLVASNEGFTSDSVTVIINREMTEAEMIREYKNTCEHVTAEYVRRHQSSMVGDRVRLWGRTIEYFAGHKLHLVNGDDHWIADLSGFDEIPSRVGLSCYCWGEVTGQNRSFYTSGGSSVTAPILDAVYFEVSY